MCSDNEGSSKPKYLNAFIAIASFLMIALMVLLYFAFFCKCSSNSNNDIIVKCDAVSRMVLYACITIVFCCVIICLTVLMIHQIKVEKEKCNSEQNSKINKLMLDNLLESCKNNQKSSKEE